METIEIDKNLLVKEIIGKFDYLLSLADAGEVSQLDSALAQVMPALPTSVIDFKVGCKNDNEFTQVNLSFLVSPIREAIETPKVSEKLYLLIEQLNHDDLALLVYSIDNMIDTKAEKIEVYVSQYAVMEIAPQKWIIHFYLKTL